MGTFKLRNISFVPYGRVHFRDKTIMLLIFRFADDIELMTGTRPGIYWLICWKYLSPLAMLLILISSFFELATEGSGYDAWIRSEGDTVRKTWPIWAVVLVLVLVLASVLWIPGLAICRLVTISYTFIMIFICLIAL